MAVGYITDQILNISRGLIKDAEPRNIFGYNSAIGTEYIAAWELNTSYVYPNAALKMSANSTSASDTSVTIRVVGLDQNYDVISENLTLNGTSDVVTTNEYFRINDVITIANNAIGNISLTNNSTTYARVAANTGKNQASIFTVPRGHEFYLYRIDCFCATATLNNRILFFRNYTRSPSDVVLQVAQTTFSETMNIQRRIPFRYTEKTDIQLQVRGSAGSQEVGVFAEGVLLKVPRVAPLSNN
jgi:hypothetical protein